MYKYDPYARPYCNRCKLIWGKRSIGSVLKCTKCGQNLILKSFNPLSQLLKGLGILSVGGLTMLTDQFPIIWIGGFLWGIQIIFNGFKQWNNVNSLDRA